MPNVTHEFDAQAVEDHEFLLHAPEIFVFSSCFGLVRQLRIIEGLFKPGEAGRMFFARRIDSLLFDLTCAAQATNRFDLVMPVIERGRFSPCFWRWFNWWSDYRNTLTPEQIAHIERLGREGNPAVKHYRPEGDWARYRQTPAFVLELV